LKGETVAVDSYVWLHRALFTCARELCEGRATDKYVSYFLRQLDVLQRAGITPLCVFDGGPLPSKRAEEEARAARRADSLAKAREHLRSGNGQAAQECFSRAVDVSPAMAARVISALCSAGVQFVVAPYEADAQCALLAASGLCSAVLTEDSDLLAHGCSRVLFKLDSARGTVEEICLDRLPLCRELSFAGWSHAQFLQLCVLSGCDYINSPPGVGVKKAHALLKKFKSLSGAARSLRFEGVRLPEGYDAKARHAELTFLHHWVFDAASQQMVHRMPLPPGGIAASDLPPGGLEELIGPCHPPDVAVAIAEGRICPISLQPFAEDAAPAAAAPRPRLPSGDGAPRSVEISSFFKPQPRPAARAAPPQRSPGEPESEGRSKRARREATDAAAVAAQTERSLLADILGPPPSGDKAAPFLSIYDEAAAAPASASVSPTSSVDPSPIRPHKLAWTLKAPPRPLQPRAGNVAPAAAKPPPAIAPERPVMSRFFAQDAAPVAPAAPAAAAAVAAAAQAAPVSPVASLIARCAANAAEAAVDVDTVDPLARRAARQNTPGSRPSFESFARR
jgi:exonuclease-1